MNIKKVVIFCALLFLQTSIHAASFDCKSAESKTEKTICGNEALSTLDSKLHITYQRAYAAHSIDQAILRRGERDWIRYVRDECADEICLAITYQVRINQLASLTKSKIGDNREAKRRVLSFKGIQLGHVLNRKQAYEDFQNFSCNRRKDKLLSSIAHQFVATCNGKVIFEDQPMTAAIFLNAGRRVTNILLYYDTPYPEEGVNSTSVSEMENRLIATYGQPNILRTESSHQPVQYDIKDLIDGDSSTTATDWGADLWAFADGASVIMEPGAGYQKEAGGHYFSTESVTFNSDRKVVPVTLPARHPFPVILMKVALTSGNEVPWKADEKMTVQFYPGGKRTCTIGALSLTKLDNRVSNYMTAITCTEFIQVADGDSVMSPPAPTVVSIVRDGNELAAGYIPVWTAVANLEHR